MTTLASLNADHLIAIANALDAGYIGVPVRGIALSRYVPAGAEDIAAELSALASGDAARASAILRLVADVRREAGSSRKEVELVCSGPESAAVPTRDTRVVVRDLFARAEHSVVVAGFAVYQGHDVFSALAERMEVRPDLAVEMYLDIQRPWGDRSTAAELVGRFARRFREQQWPGSRLPRVYYDARSLAADAKQRTSLHAKCVVVDESSAFVTSANFTEAAQLRNIEVGLLLRDATVASRLAAHFRSLSESGVLERVPGV